jgi:hypothetical protein
MPCFSAGITAVILFIALVTASPESIALYTRIQFRARQIVAKFPVPDFYRDHPQAMAISRRIFDHHPLVTRLRTFTIRILDDEIGHGILHANKVSLDAGALVFIEGNLAGYSESVLQRRIIVAQCAGLLHDIERKKQDHASMGAMFARNVLKDYPFMPAEIEDICCAIENHEAFKKNVPLNTPEGLLVSNCLYDSDKFRWGPDNFTDTVWAMVIHLDLPLMKFLARFPKGMSHIARIKNTFRSTTGRKYGPQMIDLGLLIGQKIYRMILTEFAPYAYKV